MKRERRVIIKDLRLKNIRNNLRLIIWHAFQKRIREICKKYDSIYWINGQFGHPRKPTNEEISQAHRFQYERWELIRAMKKSIIQCAVCNQLDRDMIYYPLRGGYICIECFELYHHEWEKRHKIVLINQDF